MEDSVQYILGIDLGVASVGWAMVEINSQHQPIAALQMGVRIFEPGMEGNIERGREKSRNLARRQARLARRQIWRRARRKQQLYKTLAEADLLPILPTNQPENQARCATLHTLDKKIQEAWKGRAPQTSLDQLLPYILRAHGLAEKLQPYELGRVFYQLGQRRGFKSNRRENIQKEDEDRGKVKSDISQLSQEIQAADAKSLGEYFSHLEPQKTHDNEKEYLHHRVRHRFTKRSMFETQFELIWQQQTQYYPDILTPALKQKLQHILYFQRPIATQDHLIGRCELEPKEKRAPWASLEAERFRMLQKLNDLRIDQGWNRTRDLTQDERQKILQKLEQGWATFKELKKEIGLNNHEKFNLQRGADEKANTKKMPGLKIEPLMATSFGKRWHAMTQDQKINIVDQWRKTETAEIFEQQAREKWDLDPQQAKKLSETLPEDGYCSLSLSAIQKLLPDMETGVRFATAREKHYERKLAETGLDRLPPAIKALPEIRNPGVLRSLTEFRKVLNAIIRNYGKPWQIRIELARDLKRSREDRDYLYKQNQERESQRKKAETEIQALGIPQPSAKDIDKWLLYKECGEICPYTGKSIGANQLFSEEIEVEHILPLSLYPDDSFANKTLCYAQENRNKGQRTPFQYYDAEQYEQILERIRHWPILNRGKLARFELKSQDEIADFSARHLNDTRYASKLAHRYAQQIYGETDLMQTHGGLRNAVTVSSGTVTATLRRHWQMEKLLKPTAAGGKQRFDHRHHAIDALVIACTQQKVIQQMSMAAAAGYAAGESGIRTTRTIPAPWSNFIEQIQPILTKIQVSHRPNHRLSGALHAGTNYSQPKIDPNNQKSLIHIRKYIWDLNDKTLKTIADPAVRDAVDNKIQELHHNYPDQKNYFKMFRADDPTTLPYLTNNKGEKILIRKVRIIETGTPRAIGQRPHLRFVEDDAIHHIEIFERKDKKGKTIWDSQPVKLLDAAERKTKNLPVVNHIYNEDPEAKFLFSLMKGDLLELALRDQNVGTARIKKFYMDGRIWLAEINNAQKDEEQKASRAIWSKTADGLLKCNARKINIDILGNITEAHD